VNTTKTWTPEPAALPWDRAIGSLRCPGCPSHALVREDGRYELVVEGVGLDGGTDHRDALRVLRRAPDFGSGPFEVPDLPRGMPAIAVIDYLERQTFDAHEIGTMAKALAERFLDAVVHVWAIGDDITHRIAEDAYLPADMSCLIRSPVIDIAPHEYPMDVGWASEAEAVETPADGSVELWRGCLYVDPMRPELVRYGWRDLPGSPDATTEA
jgi:hypothetical protein